MTKDQQPSQLLPCPFCAHEFAASMFKRDHGTWWVECLQHDCGASGAVCKSNEDAVAAWNTRAALHSTSEGAQWRCVNCKWVTPMLSQVAPERCLECWCRQFAEVAVVSTSEGRVVRHKKRGTLYTVIGVGRAQGGLSDEDPVVLYRGEDGGLWVRHHAEFCDGRFEYADGDTALGGSNE